MSRVGKTPIVVPAGVDVQIDGREVRVKGPKGALFQRVHPDIGVRLEDGRIVVTRPTDNRLHRSQHGLTRTLVANMVQGVSTGFTRTLEISGVGYRVQQSGDKLVFQLGYSHPVEFPAPEGIGFSVETPTRVHVMGIDKALVGDVAARIRRLRPPEPYKGKGVRFAGERLRRKAGKAGKAAGRK